MAQPPTLQRLAAICAIGAAAPERCLIWGVLRPEDSPGWHLAERRAGGRWVEGDFLVIARGWWAALPDDPPHDPPQPDQPHPDQPRADQPRADQTRPDQTRAQSL